jgi:hypothetical protein
MIPFNLERAKKGVPMYTRNGYTAIFISLLDGGQPAPLVVDVPGKDGLENYYRNGRHGPVHDSPLDLFMKY